MHTGRVSHPANLPAGARLLAPSALAAPGEMWTDSKGQPHPVPVAMSEDDILETINEYSAAANGRSRRDSTESNCMVRTVT